LRHFDFHCIDRSPYLSKQNVYHAIEHSVYIASEEIILTASDSNSLTRSLSAIVRKRIFVAYDNTVYTHTRIRIYTYINTCINDIDLQAK